MSLTCPVVIQSAAPALCRQIDVYCERVGFTLDGEPLNAITNFAMIVAAILLARLQLRRPNHGSAGLIWAAIGLITLGGIGATLFHTTAAIWAVWVDMMPFLAFMLIILWLTLTRFLAWPAWGAALALVGFFALTFGLGPLLPAGIRSGGAYYLPPLVVLSLVSVVLYRRRSPAAGAYSATSVVFIGALAARQLDEPLCDALPSGTHFLWHLLAALLAFILIRAAILYAPPKPAAP